MRNILILHSQTGGGHKSVALALQGALGHVLPPDFAFHVTDVFERAAWPLRRVIYSYGPVTIHAPAAYGTLFRATNRGAQIPTLTNLITPTMCRKFYRELRELKPELIVSCHALANQVLLVERHRFGVHIPVVSIVTDLVSIHRAWAEPEIEYNLCPTEESRQAIIDWGVPAEKTRLFGLPVAERFVHQHKTQAEIRRDLQLEPDRFTMLLIGGREGVGPIADCASAIMRQHPEWQLLVVAGVNETLRQRLVSEAAQARSRARVFGFVHDVPDMMSAADIVVTKAGSVTLAESLVRQRPVIIVSVIPGQEDGNVDYISRNGVGGHAQTPRELVHLLEWLYKHQDTELRRWTENTKHVGKPHAAAESARFIAGMLGIESQHHAPHAAEQATSSGR